MIIKKIYLLNEMYLLNKFDLYDIKGYILLTILNYWKNKNAGGKDEEKTTFIKYFSNFFGI